MLCDDLEAGALIRRTGGFRKLRYALGGGGKSGGARVICLRDEPCERVYMILVYAKGVKETLTRKERERAPQLGYGAEK
jgi:hypothetical protein